MRKKILEALNTKFPGVSDNKLNRIVDNLLKKIKTEEEIESAVEDITVESLLESYGDARADGAQRTAVANYEKKHNLKDGKPVEDEGNGGEHKNDTTKNGGATVQVAGKPGDEGAGEGKLSPEMQIIMNKLNSLEQQNQTLTAALNTMKAEKVGTTREGILRDLLKNVDEDTRNRYLRDYGFMSFDTDDKFNSYIEAIKPEIEKIETSTEQAKALVSSTKGGGSASAAQGKVNPVVQARIDESKAETTSPAIIGLSN